MEESLDFDINTKSIKKACDLLKKEADLEFCLQAKVCPICTNNLIICDDYSINTVYKCKKCGFSYEKE